MKFRDRSSDGTAVVAAYKLSAGIRTEFFHSESFTDSQIARFQCVKAKKAEKQWGINYAGIVTSFPPKCKRDKLPSHCAPCAALVPSYLVTALDWRFSFHFCLRRNAVLLFSGQ